MRLRLLVLRRRNSLERKSWRFSFPP